MTKKNNLSELDTRRIRKQLKKIDQNWSQVDELYNTIATGIVEVAANVNQAIQLINLVSVDKNENEIVAVTRTMKNDIESFTRDLITIQSRHKNYGGPIRDENELALCLSVFSDYSELNERFRAIIFNPMLTITEFLTVASEKIKYQSTGTDNDQPI